MFETQLTHFLHLNNHKEDRKKKTKKELIHLTCQMFTQENHKNGVSYCPGRSSAATVVFVVVVVAEPRKKRKEEDDSTGMTSAE